MRKLLLTLLFLLVATSASAEIIRPTGAATTNARWANTANAYDNSLTTASDITGTTNDDSLWVGATGTVATDAWETPTGTYSTATLYCTYSSDGWSNDDTFRVQIVNSADTVLSTLQADTGAAVTKTTGTYALSGGELSDPTDLRCKAHYERNGGADTGASYVYEVWIDGTVAGGRYRIFNLGKNEEVQDEEVNVSHGDVVDDRMRPDTVGAVCSRRTAPYYDYHTADY